MQLPFLRRPGRIFLFYGLIISALSLYAFYLCREKERQYAEHNAWMKTVIQARKDAEGNVRYAYKQIEHNSSNSCGYNDSLLHEATFAFKKSEEMDRKIEQQIDAATPVQSNTQKVLLLEAMRLNNTLTASKQLTSLQNRIPPDWAVFDGVYPVVYNINQSKAGGGKIFKGNVDLKAYLLNSSILRMFIDDQPVPVDQGIGKFQRVYKTPGVKHVKTKIVVQEPLTGRIHFSTKEFLIEIYP